MLSTTFHATMPLQVDNSRSAPPTAAAAPLPSGLPIHEQVAAHAQHFCATCHQKPPPMRCPEPRLDCPSQPMHRWPCSTPPSTPPCRPKHSRMHCPLGWQQSTASAATVGWAAALACCACWVCMQAVASNWRPACAPLVPARKQAHSAAHATLTPHRSASGRFSRHLLQLPDTRGGPHAGQATGAVQPHPVPPGWAALQYCSTVVLIG